MSPAPKRRSLRDRNVDAIAGPLEPTPPDTAVEEATTPTPTSSKPTSSKPTSSKPTSSKPTSSKPPQPAAAKPKPKPTKPVTKRVAGGQVETARLGIYFTPNEFDAAKAAYLADWQHGGTSDTFARWIAAALEAHATRPPQIRAELARPQERAAHRTGATRSFTVPASTVAQLRQAVVADNTAGRWPSDSAWCGDAIAAAVGQARTNAGGSLPTPPARLPNRLTR